MFSHLWFWSLSPPWHHVTSWLSSYLFSASLSLSVFIVSPYPRPLLTHCYLLGLVSLASHGCLRLIASRSTSSLPISLLDFRLATYSLGYNSHKCLKLQRSRALWISLFSQTAPPVEFSPWNYITLYSGSHRGVILDSSFSLTSPIKLTKSCRSAYFISIPSSLTPLLWSVARSPCTRYLKSPGGVSLYLTHDIILCQFRAISLEGCPSITYLMKLPLCL